MKVILTTSPAKICRPLFIFSLFLITVSFCCGLWLKYGNSESYDFHWIFTRIFDFNVKNNLPHAFKSILLLFSAFIIYAIVQERKAAGGAYLGRWKTLGWIFFWICIDEEIRIHTETVSTLSTMLVHQDPDKAAYSKIYWLIPYGVLTLAFAAAYLPFLMKLPAKVRNWMAGAGVVYVGGAAVLEAIMHTYSKHFGDDNLPYLMMSNVAEWMQMTGSIMFIYSLLTFHRLNTEETIIQLGEKTS